MVLGHLAPIDPGNVVFSSRAYGLCVISVFIFTPFSLFYLVFSFLLSSFSFCLFVLGFFGGIFYTPPTLFGCWSVKLF